MSTPRWDTAIGVLILVMLIVKVAGILALILARAIPDTRLQLIEIPLLAAMFILAGIRAGRVYPAWRRVLTFAGTQFVWWSLLGGGRLLLGHDPLDVLAWVSAGLFICVVCYKPIQWATDAIRKRWQDRAYTGKTTKL